MKFLIGFIFILFTFSTASFAQSNAEHKDLKVISEKKDKHGNTVRVIEYYKNNMKVTETTITPPFPGLGERKPIDLDNLNKDSVLVYVDKTNYLVAVIYKRKRIRQYRAVFGPDRLKDKMMEGDRSTPEGWFTILAKRDHRNWQKFILIDYPNEQSKINFQERKAKGIIPKNARIGNSIGFHGTIKTAADMVDYGIGWTDGCIALKPEDIEDLYQFVSPGTRVYVKR